MERSLSIVTVVLMVLFGYSCDNDSEPTDLPKKNFQVKEFQANPINKSNEAEIYVHYMSWFETKTSADDGQWGYHWTLGTHNPDAMDSNGDNTIAAHYHPLIGPYHSGDPAVIEYHLLLMKYAGIDGVLIDWYGTYDVNDYAGIHQNSEQFIALLDKVGLRYAFVYEDRFLGEIVQAQLASNTVEVAVTDFNYLREFHFSKPNYLKRDQKPLVMVFGPITLESPESWQAVFEQSKTNPYFLTLWNESGEAQGSANGEFSWVYKDQSYLEQFYTHRTKDLDFAIGSAYPGFEDYYTEAGIDAGIDWEIPHSDGVTFRKTLKLFTNSSLDWLQLITWNDFGEGTMIEPSREMGFSSLEILHDFAGVQLSKEVLQDCYQLYQLRRLYPNDSEIQLMLDQAFYYLISLQVEKAQLILNDIKNNP